MVKYYVELCGMGVYWVLFCLGISAGDEGFKEKLNYDNKYMEEVSSQGGNIENNYGTYWGKCVSEW